MFKFDLWNSILQAPDGNEPSSADPFSTPVETAAPSADEPSPGGDNFEFLDQLDTEGDDVEVITAPESGEPASADVPPKTPASPTDPKASPPGTPPAPKETPPLAAPQPQPTPTPGPQEQPKTAPSEPPKDAFTQFVEDKPKIMEALAKSTYALSKDDLDLLEANPGQALPLMAARVHTEVFAQVIQATARMIQQGFGHMQEETRQNSEAVSAFQAKWPQIDLQAHGADIATAAELIRKTNPNATKEEAINLVGAMVVAMKGLAATPLASPAPATPPKPVAPAPFRPAGSGVVLPPGTVVAEEFAFLGQEEPD